MYDYYFEQGKDVPQWKTKKNPDWWDEYLEDLGIDPRNPDLRDSNPVKSSVNQLGEQMANSPVDKSKEFIDKGMTLITNYPLKNI